MCPGGGSGAEPPAHDSGRYAEQFCCVYSGGNCISQRRRDAAVLVKSAMSERCFHLPSAASAARLQHRAPTHRGGFLPVSTLCQPSAPSRAPALALPGA